ncbi:hypothetical protein RMATCC62417_05230 [Rhizopus microsporus]|nr:hypothetical protein RMATCC62417_05230 [Rhizopus microsporus]
MLSRLTASIGNKYIRSNTSNRLLLNQKRAFGFTKSISREAADSTKVVKFTTSTYNDAISRLKSQGKLAGKITVYTVLSVSAAIGLIWQLAHLYIEYTMESTPKELGFKGRQLLHGAYVREQLAPDYDIASMYIREVIRIALEEQNLKENSDTIINLRLRLAEDENKSGNLLDAITEYTRAWKLLMDNGKSHDQQTITAAKKIGDLYMRIDDYEHAEEFLAWAFHMSEKASQDDLLQSKIKLSLANLYAIQRNFKLSIPLLSQLLKSLPEEQHCLRAIVQNQLSEIMYGLDKKDEAMGWAQTALETCTKDIKNQDCLECGAIASNNMGRMLELSSEFEQALAYYNQAIKYASDAGNLTSHESYSLNSERVQDIIAIKETKH